MSKLVEPFMYGSHLHYEDMPLCATCADENAKWDKLIERTHTYELAQKIARTPAYKAYRQAKPFDDAETTLSLDAMMDNGLALADEAEPMLELVARADDLNRFRKVLSPKQLHIFELLLMGMDSRAIYQLEGYRSTGGVRYHKHVIRKKYRNFLLGLS